MEDGGRRTLPIVQVLEHGQMKSAIARKLKAFVPDSSLPRVWQGMQIASQAESQQNGAAQHGVHWRINLWVPGVYFDNVTWNV